MSLKTVNSAIITGNTFAVREQIKRLGGVWDKDRKAWVIDIQRHPDNTMRARSGLQSQINALTSSGCRIEYT